MGKSDLPEYDEWGECVDRFKMAQDTLDIFGNERDEMHSGQFMISSLDDDGGAADENNEPPAYDFSGAKHETASTYLFGENIAIEIDTSLASLFNCMSLAYSGRLTSPKWKNFKGLKVSVKDKVRLNNIIWREWHMQYIQGKRHKICQFENPLTDKTHVRSEAVVLEGKYWKRRLTNVTAEYQKWRSYHHKEQQQARFSNREALDGMCSESENIKSNVFRFGQSNRPTECLSPPLDAKIMEEDLMMDLTDTLFSSISGPFLFPNPREFGQLGNADIIQPGLVQLQPTVEEFMDTLEPLPSLQEMVSASKMAGSSSATQDSLFGDSQSLFNPPHSSHYSKHFDRSRTDSPQLNSSTNLVNPNAVLGSGPVSPEFADLSSSTSGYASNTSSLLSEPRRLGSVSGTKNTSRRLKDNRFSRQQYNNNSNSGFNQANVCNTQSGPSLFGNSRPATQVQQQILPPNETSGLVATATTSSTSGSGGGTTSSQSDAAARLLSLILGNNVGGATTQLQQLITSGGNHPQGPDSVLPQQILQLLIQLQQHQRSQSQETLNFETATNSPPPQSPPQQGPNICEQIFPPIVCKQEKSLGFTSSNLFSSTPVQPVKKEKPRQVIKYSQLQNLLQGQSVSPVTKVSQPVARIQPEQSIIQRQSSQGALSLTSSKDLTDRHRSKSGDSFITQEQRRSSTGSLGASQHKQGTFLVPQSPATPRVTKVKNISKQVKIAPSVLTTISPGNSATAAAGKPSVAAQNTFLAKLLTADKQSIIKEEKPQPYPTIRPKPAATKTVTINTNPVTVATASNIALPMSSYQDNTQLEYDDIDKNGLSDFQKALMIATAGQSYNVSSAVKLSDLLNNSVTIAQCSSGPVIGTITESGSPQFQVPSPTDNSVDSLRNRSRHSSNESGDSTTPTTFTLEAVKEEQVQSPGRSRRKTELDPVRYREHRRNCHINAEQKRRYNIKHGFDTLCALVPTLTHNPNAKVSKAAILQKSAEHCAKLKKEKAEMYKETERLKKEIEALNNAIGNCQSQLPATGVPVNRQRATKMKEKFEEYVKQRTLQNWKFWIFSIIVSPLFETYNNTVSMATLEEMYRSAMSWQDQHCSLTVLRKVVVESLQKLSTSTDILSEPSKLPEQAIQAVQLSPSDNDCTNH